MLTHSKKKSLTQAVRVSLSSNGVDDGGDGGREEIFASTGLNEILENSDGTCLVSRIQGGDIARLTLVLTNDRVKSGYRET